eukprot:CAMPEP_0201523170 /NCGR_PEP_ID=MMETSP0161_2-20130828/18837_1 /ASSEMBLY_ACC=CAM_ASM_000251 /TAXON_ID=180227 /ORGANISM="Neoparamoeba aestuarina, Strain SoJaBio B1-5/56/2" /LENGTH=450 /DNA_ID=CAMNT_0047922189 /DNA_START=326 /DNA_END=1678 /DNA_ORIENTATION=-
MNCFSIFKKLVREEYKELDGNTTLLLRNTSHATKWMKGIVEAESSDMVLLEKRVLWLLQKGCGKTPESPKQNRQSQTQPKKSSFLAPSVAVHQVIIQKEETPDGAGYEWCEGDTINQAQALDADSRQLFNCILGIMHCCTQVPSLCRLSSATSDEVRKLKKDSGIYGNDPNPDEDDFSVTDSPNFSASSPHFLSQSDPNLCPKNEALVTPTEKEALSNAYSSPSKKKDKKKKGTKGSPAGRAMRRKIPQEERELYCWAVTNIVLLHFAVPIIAARSVKCKPGKSVVKFSKLVSRAIMKIAAQSEMNKGTDFEKYNPVLSLLYTPFLNFCQDVVDSGIAYPNYAPEIKRNSLQKLRNDLDEVKGEDFADVVSSATEMCDLIIKKGTSKKIARVSQQTGSLDDINSDLDDEVPALSEEIWRSPSLMEVEGDDYDCSLSIGTFNNSSTSSICE